MTLLATNIAPNAEKIDEAVRYIARQRNVADRVAALKTYEALPMFKRCLEYAYNPYIKFGVELRNGDSNTLVSHCILNGPGMPTPSLDITDQDIWDTLDDLRTSTAASVTKREILRRLFERVNIQTGWLIVSILDKCLITGVAASTVNKAFPDLIPTFGVQLAQKYTDRKIKEFPAYVEPKYDGIRCTAIVHPSGDVDTLTRTGRDIPAARRFHDELRKIGQRYKALVEAAGLPYRGVVLDGEVLDDTFNETVSTFRKDVEAKSGTYSLFDIVPIQALQGGSVAPYTGRRKILTEVVQTNELIKLAPSYVVNSKAEIWNLYNKAREMGMEGVIVKPGSGLWQTKRSNDWLKVKAEETEDLIVTGAFEGEGQLEGTLGGLIVDRAGVAVRVGSGFTHAERNVLWGEFLDDLVTSQSGSTDYKLVGTYIEVQYQEVTPDGSLRHPVFVRRRRDKDEVSF